MRLSRLTKLAAAASVVALVVPATATAAPGTAVTGRDDNPVTGGRVPAAQRALEAVRAAFDRDGSTPARRIAGGELTQQLLQLRLGLDELSPRDRRTAESYLARPTDGSEYYGANYGKDARPTNDCRKAPTPGSEVCVHWARRTVDAPPKKDSDGDGLPNQVEKTREMMNLVWGRTVDAGNYRPPLPDEKGPDTKLDVYLVDIGGDGLYGYCGPEYVGSGRSWAAYCVLDDDYAPKQFPAHTPLANLQVTAAHEFFHAVQFGYDVQEDVWMMESTATWIEDEIFGQVNDNRYYLSNSALKVPQRPLDTSAGLFVYGNWIWWRYLTERFPEDGGTGLPVLVRKVWEAADSAGSAKGTYSVAALEQVLSGSHGKHLGRVFADFSSANRYPSDTYREGEAYPRAPLSGKFELTGSKRSTGTKTRTLPHLSSSTVAFYPESGYADDSWQLDVHVDLPGRSHAPFAEVMTVRADGSVTHDPVDLSRTGAGSVQVPFSSSDVVRVELTLTNGSRSYDCNEGTSWSCHGIPDKKRDYRFWAEAVQ